MKKFIGLVFILVFVIGSISLKAQPLRVNNEFMIIVPNGWELVDSTGDYPYRYMDSDQSAEVFVFLSSISNNETIDNAEQLRYSVQAVIEGVLPEFSSLELIRDAGYLGSDNASFVIDFISADSLTEARTYNRLKGILHRLNDNSQILYTLWAKTAPGNFMYQEPAIETMLESFEYIGPRKGDVFPVEASKVIWYLVFAVAGLAAVMIYINRLLQQRARMKLSSEINFWHCSCGRLNHNSRNSCRRCGYEQVQVKA